MIVALSGLCMYVCYFMVYSVVPWAECTLGKKMRTGVACASAETVQYLRL